jgi:nucleoside-diphosphate-sugar epimerase
LTTQGAQAVVCNIYDPRLADHVAGFWPDAVIHQVTDLPSRQALIPMKLASLNKARTRGTDALIAAARAAGASTFIAQSVAFSLPGIAQRAVDHLERETLAYPGIVLRYGAFYGPGTWNSSAPASGPVVEVTAAAQQTARALEAAPGIYEVTDEGTRAVGS